MEAKIQNYSLFIVSQENNFDLNKDIIQYIKDSKEIIINRSKSQTNPNIGYDFIIVFKKTLIFVESSNIFLLQDLFSYKNDLIICFLPNTKEIFDKYISIQYKESNNWSKYSEEISSISENMSIIEPKNSSIRKVWNFILPCISSYLIIQSYYKTKEDRIKKFFEIQQSNNNTKIFEENDYVLLKNIGNGSMFNTVLIYYIENEELLIIKQPNNFDKEIQDLLKREIKNYSKIKHPLIPKFYGTTKKENYPVIEFINGHTLYSNTVKFSFNEKINIIFQMLLIFNYLHQNHYIYRDLKPNNIMIDQNKAIILIDFDRMINYDDLSNNSEFTFDLQSIYMAPEYCSGIFSYDKCDIYSIGLMIYYIIEEKDFRPDKPNNFVYLNNFPEMTNIFKYCVNLDYEKRPPIFYILNKFFDNLDLLIEIDNFLMKYEYFFKHFGVNISFLQSKLGSYYYNLKKDIKRAIHYFLLAANNNDTDSLVYLGYIFYQGEYVERDIDKAINFFTLAANLNSIDAHFNLSLIYIKNKVDINKGMYHLIKAADGNMPQALLNISNYYLKGKYVSQDIEKALTCLTKAANQNYPEAQYNLGSFYHNKKYGHFDMNKAIYYYTLAALNNFAAAQYNLGNIYFEGIHVERDINKGIYFYTMSANSDFPSSHHNLGNIYYFGTDIPRNIEKGLYHLTKAANLNCADSQYQLGIIYSNGHDFPPNYEKGIYYFTQAADNNCIDAQYILGSIYSEGKYAGIDINKAIKYFSLAANNNNSYAQIKLGLIYMKGKYIKEDISKAIYYFMKAADENNDPKGQYYLGTIYKLKKYGYYDIEKSIHYYKLSAQQNHSLSQFSLGCLYYEQKDINKALNYFLMAAKNNEVHAEFILGSLYYEGKDVELDINKSIYYLTLAAKKGILKPKYILV